MNVKIIRRCLCVGIFATLGVCLGFIIKSVVDNSQQPTRVLPKKIAMPELDEPVYLEGACGTDARWSFDSATETLEITGSGELYSYSSNEHPWASYYGYITKAIVDDGITIIPKGTFYSLFNLEELTVPFIGYEHSIGVSSTTHYPLGHMFGASSYEGSIGVYQFVSYDYLSKGGAFIPSVSMSSRSLYYVPANLQTVNVTGSTYIFSGAFSFYYDGSYSRSPLNVTSISLNDGVTTIGDYAFACYGNSNVSSALEEIEFPSTLESIGGYAFYRCGSLANEEMPASLETIGSYAFYECRNISADLGQMVSSIGSYAFYDCVSLNNLAFPNSLTSISDYAFYGCEGFNAINIPQSISSIGSYAFAGCVNVESLTMEEGLQSIGDYAFRGLSKVRAVTVPTTVTSMGAGLFGGMSSLEELITPFVGNSQNIVEGYTAIHYPLGYMFGTSSYEGSLGVYQFISYDYLSGGVFLPSTSDSSKGLYYVPASLQTVNITSSRYIFSGAFSFYYNSSSSKVPLNITSISLNEGITDIGDDAFACLGNFNLFSALEDINFPSTLMSIGNSAFYRCGNLIEADLPDSLAKIGSHCFFECDSLANVSIPETISSIPTYAFYGCDSFTAISIPHNIQSIGDYAFTNCVNVESLIMEEGLQSIGESVFRGLNKVRVVTVPTSVTSMGAGLFGGMSSLEELTVPFVGNSQAIGASSMIHYPLGYMFGTSSYEGSISIYQYISYDYLSDGVFTPNVSESSKSLYYVPASLRSVNITNSRYVFSGAFSFYYSDSNSRTPLNVTSISLNEGITDIGDYAFACYAGISSLKSSLEEMDLPSTLKTIGNSAFYRCGNLVGTELPDSLRKIGSHAFYECHNISANCGRMVKTIGSYAFYNCDALNNQIFPSTLTSIGDYAFYGCEGFDAISIPENVSSIGSYAFAYCSNVESLTMEEGTQTIGDCAFRGLNKVRVVTVPTTVTSMGAGLFGGMSSLEELTVPFVGNSQAIGASSMIHYPLGYMFGTSSYEGSISIYQYISYDYLSDGVFTPNVSESSKSLYYVPASLRSVNITNSRYVFSGAFSFYYSDSNSRTPLNVTSISLNEGITDIGDDAFACLGNFDLFSALEDISIPSTLKSIGGYAFYRCANLVSAEIPGSTTKIGNYAFYQCNNASIDILNFAENVTVYQYTFSNVPLVRYYNYYSYTNGNNTFFYNVINDEAIIAKTRTTNTDMTLPTTLGSWTVTKVGNMGVANCETLTRVAIPANIVELGDYAFSGCTGLTTVTIPATCLHVGDYAFSGCTNLTTTTIAEGVEYVGDFAFFNCDNLSEIVIPDSCVYLGKGAFYNCESLSSATIGITVPEINDYAFFNCSSLETIVIGLSVTSIGDYAFKNCSSIGRITTRSGMLSIGEGAFMNCSSMNRVTLASTITDIGAFAFYGCSSLASVSIPQLVTEIKDSTFEDCSLLATASYTGTVTSIGNRAFYGTAITSFNFKEGLESLGSASFAHAKLTTVHLPDSLISIGQLVFDRCQLVSVSMPSGAKLQENCYRIFAHHAPELVITVRFVLDPNLDDYLLYRSGAKQVIIEEGIQSIGDYALAKNVLVSIDLPSTLKSIGDYAFYDCEELQQLTLPENVLTAGEYAFANDYVLTDVYLPDSMVSIGGYAFYKSNRDRHPAITVHIYAHLGDVCDYLLDSQHMDYAYVEDDVSTLGDCVFANCPYLKYVYVGDFVSSIGDYVFSECPILDRVSVSDYVSAFGQNNFLNDHAVTLKIRYVDGFVDDYVYNDNLLYVTTVIVDENIEGIGSHTFYNDTSLLVIEIPNTVQFIGDYCFYNCNSVTQINIPSGVEIIYSHTFFGCASLQSILIPDTVTAIEDYAFYGCVSATSLTISNACESIESNAFYNCKSIEELIIPDSVKFIGTYAFRSCVEITELRFGDNVEEIGACAFYDCNSLERVYLGKRIIRLEDRLFYGCVNLADLYVYAPLSYIHELAFYGAEECVIHMGYDAYMIQTFNELSMEYVIDESIIYEYKIVFLDYDGSIISSETYHSGDSVIIPADPTRNGDEIYSYTFAGWDKEVVTVGGNETYTATYSRAYVEYTVTFYNDDGTVFITQTYHFGDLIQAPANNPTKASDNTYSYTFAGWDKELGTCSGNASFTATYSRTYVEYTITFVDDDGTVISTNTYHYGEEVIVPSNPTKASDNTYSYAFAGWDNVVTSVTGNATYTATYSSTYIEYTVTFLDDDGRTISTSTYHYGDQIQAPANPTKVADSTYTYTFAGWDNAVSIVTGNMTFRATYSRTYINYTITFYNEDGTVFATETYHYGDQIQSPANNPAKPSDNVYSYAFAGWNNELGICTGNASFAATFNRSYIEYTVTFLNDDGTTVSSSTYHYGEEVLVPSNPTKASDNTYSYAFAGWDNVVTSVTGNATYTATYSSTYIEYTVTFLDDDGRTISTSTYHYGDQIQAPANPTKVADSTYTYTFAGWDNAVSIVTGNMTFRATYSRTYINYTITFYNEDGTVFATETYHYGDQIQSPANNPAKPSDNVYSYTFAGWNDELGTCTGNASFTATFTRDYIEYTVTFVNDDGTVISTNTYHYGEEVVTPADPAKSADNTYTYSFAGWDKEVVAVNGDATYMATYTRTYIEYTVTFLNDDGTTISTSTYHYGDQIQAPADPTKASDETYDYTFIGWDKEVGTCTGNQTFTATYSEAYNEQYLSAQLREELLEEIAGVNEVDLSTYATIADIESRMADLTDADKAIVQTALNGLIGKYNEYVRQINGEFEESQAIANQWIFGAVLSSLSLLTVVAIVIKRRFAL